MYYRNRDHNHLSDHTTIYRNKWKYDIVCWPSEMVIVDRDLRIISMASSRADLYNIVLSYNDTSQPIHTHGSFSVLDLE